VESESTKVGHLRTCGGKTLQLILPTDGDEEKEIYNVLTGGRWDGGRRTVDG
jgi:hypothetical protein